MFALFIEGDNDQVDYSKVYVLSTDEAEFFAEVDALMEWGVSYDWRRIY